MRRNRVGLGVRRAVVAGLSLMLFACGVEQESQHEEIAEPGNSSQELDLSRPEISGEGTPLELADPENMLPDLFEKSGKEKKLTVDGRPMLAPGDGISQPPSVEGATINIELKTE